MTADHEAGNDPIPPLLNELQRHGITDERVLDALRRVPRARFVPESIQDQAWANTALPIGAGQTISQPYIVALMTQALLLRGEERVLEIGTGSGYQTAVLAELAGEVISLERHAILARAAESLLAEMGYSNIHIHIGDGTLGRPENAPYDRIVVTAGAPRIPKPLLDQLHPDGGRIVIPIGHIRDQRLVALERRAGRFIEENLGPVRFVPLVGRAGWGPTAENGHNL
jgi:protein-L-isoaspartate(D-aspartate) O-methyltransferase